MIALLMAVVAATPPSAGEASCVVGTSTLPPVRFTFARAPWDDLEEDCAELAGLLSLRVAPTATIARHAERILADTTLFDSAICRAEEAPDARSLDRPFGLPPDRPSGLSCHLTPGTLVSGGEVEGSLPFVLLRSDVDGRLSLRSGVPATEGSVTSTVGSAPARSLLGRAGQRQADRLAQYLVREGYFATTATASWTPTEGAEPMEAAELTVTVDVGDAATVRRIAVRGDTEALTPREAGEILRRYWLLSVFPRRFRPADFDDDLDVITDELRQRGYPEAIVRGHYTVDPDTDRVDIVLEVDAGARLELSYQGNVAIDSDDLGQISTFAEARSLDAEEIDNTAAAIRNAYQREGYFEVLVEGKTLDRPRPTLGVHYTIEEGRRAWLEEVTLTGTTAIPAVELAERAQLQTRTRSWPVASGAWVDAWVEQDQQSITDVLVLEGYGAPTVAAEVSVRPDGTLAAVFTVDAGPRRTVGTLAINGLPAEVDTAALAEALALRPGQPYLQASQSSDRRLILDALAGAGYPRAEIARKMKLPLPDQPGEVSITYTAEPGRRASFGGFLVRGNFDTARSVIGDSLELELGQPLSAKSMSDARRRLGALGVFGAVEIQPLGLWREDAPTWLLVTVEERARRALFAVASFSTDDYFALGVDYTDRNLFGRAVSLDLELRFANATQLGTDVRIGLRDRALLRLTAPRPFGAFFDVEARAYYDFVTRPETYDEQRVGVSFAASRALIERTDCPLCPALVASLGYELAATELIVRAADVVLDEPAATIGRLFARLTIDHRDSPIDPRSGYQAELRVELANRAFAGPFSGNAHDFWRFLPWARGYLELGSPLEARLDEGEIIGGPFVLAASASYGVAHPYGSRDTGADAIPRSETFAYGGDQSVRGLDDGASRGGYPSPPYLLYLSGELRYYVLQNFGFGTVQLAGFTDVGAVGAHLSSLLDDPTLSAGAAIRYVTPVGPLSVAYGWPLIRSAPIVAANPGTIPATGRLHISFGTAF